ncbi:MAG: lipoate--protein ligase family protein [Spirochaetales bacterium]|nr:lipoate--protein ligase family protein [Spirochaetales bacterium]
MKIWRVWFSEAFTGAENMAWDEALFQTSASKKTGIPVLRFYSWNPATLSLGRFQNPDLGLKPDRPNLPLVRRSTGGGAIWHADEITYSIACHQDHLGVDTVKASFERLCGFLLETWKNLGWKSVFAKDSISLGTLGQITAACFSGKEEYDILVEGKKLGGNAQRRQGGSIFQHGSIPNILDWTLLTSLFDKDSCPNPDLITDLRSLGWVESRERLEKLLAHTFARHLKVEILPWKPGDEEYSCYNESLKKYSDPDWTYKGLGSVRDRIQVASP